MRDHLNRGAKIVPAALLGDHVAVNSPRRAIIELSHPGADEALIVPQVKIGLSAVVGHVNFTVLERTHRARIHVDVGIELYHCDFQAT